ncbi:RING-type domain-containing protein [Heracleum sosnowskyi]|uniref:RING-type domain-containing protein n=1 Tax=Heracleum sosnowskyi TaxID=360622 RepID=A0AAD8I780_9APIA|nr:RING-type domain-containing protein [Heracleum sosnowskyi]
MATSNSNNDPKTIPVRKEEMAKLLTCTICNNIFEDPVCITGCLHIFCNRCICKKIKKENLNRCPVCSVYLGCMPLDKLRPDHTWRAIREIIAPSLGPAVKVDDELLSGEAEQSVPSPAKRKTGRLPSLVNKGNISSPYSFRRNRKANARKAIPSQGSDSPTDNPEKSVDGRSEGSRLSIDLNKSAQNKQFSAGESSRQQIPRRGRKRTQRTELVSNFLNPLTEAGNIRNYDETVTEGASSSKAICKPEAKTSGKNLRNCDVATRPTRKNRGQTKPVNVPQGLNFRAQTVADTSRNQHAKRVAPVWLSLDSSVNQKGVEPLPQIPRCYLMIKDATLPVSFIKKYLSQKLNLDSEEEVEISLQGSPLPSNLELHAVVDLWLQQMSNSEEIKTKVGDSAKNFVMFPAGQHAYKLGAVHVLKITIRHSHLCILNMLTVGVNVF